MARQIPDFLMEDFGKDETTGARYVDFPITGDIGHMDYSTLSNLHREESESEKNEKGVR